MFVTNRISFVSKTNESVFEKIYDIECRVFENKAFTKKELFSDLYDPDVYFIVLSKKNTIVGFVYALPEGKHTARVVDIAIEPKYQKQGLVGKLMSHLEHELKKAGYAFITEDAMIDNGYAATIAKYYTERIKETRKFEGKYGKQQYFKIKL